MVADEVQRAVVGDLGTSIASNRPVRDEVLSALSNTMILSLSAVMMAFSLAFVLGAIAVLVSDMVTPNRNGAPIAVALAALGATAALLVNQGGSSASALGGSYVAVDRASDAA